MTLVETLRQNLTGHLSDEKSEIDVRIAAKIADEFAIGFADWCKQEYELEDTSFHNKWRDVNGEYRETKELLEIYKKEKQNESNFSR
jgi:hypothetical protein